MNVIFDLTELYNNSESNPVLAKLDQAVDVVQRDYGDLVSRVYDLPIALKPTDSGMQVKDDKVVSNLYQSLISNTSLSLLDNIRKAYQTYVYEYLCATGNIPVSLIFYNEYNDNAKKQVTPEVLKMCWDLIMSAFTVDNRIEAKQPIRNDYFTTGVSHLITRFGLYAGTTVQTGCQRIGFFIVLADTDAYDQFMSNITVYGMNLIRRSYMILMTRSVFDLMISNNETSVKPMCGLKDIEVLFAFNQVDRVSAYGADVTLKYKKELIVKTPTNKVTLSVSRFTIANGDSGITGGNNTFSNHGSYATAEVPAHGSVSFRLQSNNNLVPILVVLNGVVYGTSTADMARLRDEGITIVPTEESRVTGLVTRLVVIHGVTKDMNIHIEPAIDKANGTSECLVSSKSEINMNEGSVQLHVKLLLPVLWIDPECMNIYEKVRRPSSTGNTAYDTIKIDRFNVTPVPESVRTRTIYTRLKYESKWYDSTTTLIGSSNTVEDAVHEEKCTKCVRDELHQIGMILKGDDGRNHNHPVRDDSYWSPDYPGRMNPNPTIKEGSFVSVTGAKFEEYGHDDTKYVRFTITEFTEFLVTFTAKEFENAKQFMLSFDNFSACVDYSGKRSNSDNTFFVLPNVRSAIFKVPSKDDLIEPDIPPVFDYDDYVPVKPDDPWSSTIIGPGHEVYRLISPSGVLVQFTKGSAAYEVVNTKPFVQGQILYDKPNVIMGILDMDNASNGCIPTYRIKLAYDLPKDAKGRVIPLAMYAKLVKYKDDIVFVGTVASRRKDELMYCCGLTSCVDMTTGNDLLDKEDNPDVPSDPDTGIVLDALVEKFGLSKYGLSKYMNTNQQVGWMITKSSVFSDDTSNYFITYSGSMVSKIQDEKDAKYISVEVSEVKDVDDPAKVYLEVAIDIRGNMWSIGHARSLIKPTQFVKVVNRSLISAFTLLPNCISVTIGEETFMYDLITSIPEDMVVKLVTQAMTLGNDVELISLENKVTCIIFNGRKVGDADVCDILYVVLRKDQDDDGTTDDPDDASNEEVVFSEKEFNVKGIVWDIDKQSKPCLLLESPEYSTDRYLLEVTGDIASGSNDALLNSWEAGNPCTVEVRKCTKDGKISYKTCVSTNSVDVDLLYQSSNNPISLLSSVNRYVNCIITDGYVDISSNATDTGTQSVLTVTNRYVCTTPLSTDAYSHTLLPDGIVWVENDTRDVVVTLGFKGSVITNNDGDVDLPLTIVFHQDFIHNYIAGVKSYEALPNNSDNPDDSDESDDIQVLVDNRDIFGVFEYVEPLVVPFIESNNYIAVVDPVCKLIKCPEAIVKDLQKNDCKLDKITVTIDTTIAGVLNCSVSISEDINGVALPRIETYAINSLELITGADCKTYSEFTIADGYVDIPSTNNRYMCTSPMNLIDVIETTEVYKTVSIFTGVFAKLSNDASEGDVLPYTLVLFSVNDKKVNLYDMISMVTEVATIPTSTNPDKNPDVGEVEVPWDDEEEDDTTPTNPGDNTGNTNTDNTGGDDTSTGVGEVEVPWDDEEDDTTPPDVGEGEVEL